MNNLARRVASLRHAILAGVSAVPLFLGTPTPARAQWAVFDAANFSQNVLTAARELQQIENEVTSLQNEAQMLINQARNLTSLPYSSLQQLMSTIQRTQQLLSQAQGIAYNVANIQSQFQSLYPIGYTGSTSSAQLITQAQTRWQNTLSGFQDALKTQATVVGNINTAQTQVNALVSSSQGATGALQATQAGNQLLALGFPAACRRDRAARGTGTCAEPPGCADGRRPEPGAGSIAALPDVPVPAISPATSLCSTTDPCARTT